MTTSELGRADAAADQAPVGPSTPGSHPKSPAAEPGGRPPAAAPGRSRPLRRRPVSWVAAVVLVLGLLTTAILSWTTRHLNGNNEERLLRLETKQASTVLSAVVPTIQTPLDSAVGIAIRNPGTEDFRFRAYMQAYVGAKRPFVSSSLWRISGGTARLITSVGMPPELATDPVAASRFLAAAKPAAPFSVRGPIGTEARSVLGYAVAGTGAGSRLVAYAESPLPAGRRAVVQPGSAFSDLRFALYLGRTAEPKMLLESNSAHLPVTGRTAAEPVAFGNTVLLLVAAPARPLGGTLAADLWWILALAGTAVALVAATTAEGLVRRRLAAERLTDEVEHLLGEQRTISETLQHALLPQELPVVAGIETGVRYLPGTNGVDIGGDWYDVLPLDGDRFFFVVGDVSGRGVPAGSVMAALRFAIRAYATEGHPPEVALDRLRDMLDVAEDHHFATVVCGIADVGRHEVVIASAGHPPALCVSATGAEYVDTPVGVPVGVAGRRPYRSGLVTVPPGATLLIYTDGLIERRGENIDQGLERLRGVAASAAAAPVESMLDTVVSELASAGLDDDTAILGVRWLN